MHRRRFGKTVWIITAAALATAATIVARRPEGEHRRLAAGNSFPVENRNASSSPAKGRRTLQLALVLIPCLGLAAFLGFIREPLQLRSDPAVVSELEKIRLMPNRISGTPPEIDFTLGQPYETASYNLAQGKRLYSWFGCAMCHGDGRGGSGPSFFDGWWLYGPEMVSIVSSIRDGRPHGMPAFRDKIPIDQIWQLAGYVQSVGAYKAKVAAPGRSDTRHTRPAENRAPAVILFEPVPNSVRPDQGPTP